MKCDKKIRYDKKIVGELLKADHDEISIKEINKVKNPTTKKKETIEVIHQFKMMEIKETKLVISF